MKHYGFAAKVKIEKNNDVFRLDEYQTSYMSVL